MKPNDKDRVQLTCQDCGSTFDISYGVYRRRPNDHHWRCQTCTNIKRSLIFANLTDDERLALKEQRSSAAKKVWQNLDADEYMRRCKSQQQRWNKLSYSERRYIMQKTHEGSKIYHNLPETKEKLRMQNMGRWKNMTSEERQRELSRLNLIRDQYWDSLTDMEKYIKMQRMWMKQVKVGPTEYIFNDKIKDIGLVNGTDYFWSYNTYPYIHPEYYERFGKINPITSEENFPYHEWDFILFPFTDIPILVDIDGSAHNPNMMHFRRCTNHYTERDKIDYNDSQRFYQIPDGMGAYIIECWNDRIDPKTTTLNLITGERMMYGNFINIIKDLFNPDKTNPN